MKKFKILLLIFTVALFCFAFSMAFAAWSTNMPPVTETEEGDFNTDTVIELKGVEVETIKPLVYSKYFFEEEVNGEIVNTSIGVLGLRITVTKSELDSSILNDNVLQLAGDFYIPDIYNNESIESGVFGNMVYSASGITIGSEVNKKIPFVLDINVTNSTATVDVNISFRNAIIKFLDTKMIVFSLYSR